VAQRQETSETVRLRQVKPDVPSIEPTGGKRERKDDPGVLELILVSRSR
jgi:hypothetical protein